MITILAQRCDFLNELEDEELFPYEKTFENRIKTMEPMETDTAIKKVTRILNLKPSQYEEALKQTFSFLLHLSLDDKLHKWLQYFLSDHHKAKCRYPKSCDNYDSDTYEI